MMERHVIGSRVRSWLQDPYKILSSMGLTKGNVFLDVGCGRGFLTFPASSLVGLEGLVYAVDVDERYLEEVRRRVVERSLTNITVIKTTAERLEGVPNNSVDKAVMLYSLHHIGDRAEALKRIREVLKTGGRLYIFEPISSRMFGHGTNPAEVFKELKVAGFEPKEFRKGLLFWRASASPT